MTLLWPLAPLCFVERPGPLCRLASQFAPDSGNRTDRYPPAGPAFRRPASVGPLPDTNRTALPARRNISFRDSALHTFSRQLPPLAAIPDRWKPVGPPGSRTPPLFAARAWFLWFAPAAPPLSHLLLCERRPRPVQKSC